MQEICKGKNIGINGVGSMSCTWHCTDDVVGGTVPRGHFRPAILGVNTQNSKLQ